MAYFDDVAPWAMDKLMEDFGFDERDAAAIMGNAGHESGGLEKLQEISPTVKGSRGGYGWFQWTGPRRRAYEAYCARNGLDGTSKEANYAFLFVELSGPESGAVARTKAAPDLDSKVVAFEAGYERAGVKHYPSRKAYANRALKAWQAREPVVIEVKEPEKPLQQVVLVPDPPVDQPSENGLVALLKALRGYLR